MDDRDPEALRDRDVVGHQPLAATDVADVQPAPEQERPVGSGVGLALVHQPVAHAESVQPTNGRLRLADEHRREVGIVASTGHLGQVGGVFGGE